MNLTPTHSWLRLEAVVRSINHDGEYFTPSASMRLSTIEIHFKLETYGMGTKSMQGQTAVPFELPDHRGRLHRYEDYAGHWLLLVFHRHLA